MPTLISSHFICRWFATWDVVSETTTLLAYRHHARAAVGFLDTVLPALELVPTTRDVLDEAVAMFRDVALRRRLSFCDAISLVVVTTVLEGIPCLSFDRDFAALGLEVIR